MPALLDAVRRLVARELLETLAGKRGYYIPSFYDVEYGADGTIARFVPKRPGVAPPVVRKAALKTTEAVDPPATTHLHARHRVRLALPHRSRARLREPVPLLLGRLQLPAGPRVSDRADPRARATGARAHLLARRPGVDRALRSPRHRAHPAQPEGHGLLDQPGVAAPRRPDADDRVAAQGERRAHADDRAGDRLGSPAPRHQQDDHQRRDPRSRRADLLERHREPEALLHDRPPHRRRTRTSSRFAT